MTFEFIKHGREKKIKKNFFECDLFFSSKTWNASRKGLYESCLPPNISMNPRLAVLLLLVHFLNKSTVAVNPFIDSSLTLVLLKGNYNSKLSSSNGTSVQSTRRMKKCVFYFNGVKT